MKKTPMPKMTEQEFRKRADFFVGDFVQIIGGKYAGRSAIIMRIDPFTTDRGDDSLSYCLRLSDKEGISTRGAFLRFIRHGDDAEI